MTPARPASAARRVWWRLVQVCGVVGAVFGLLTVLGLWLLTLTYLPALGALAAQAEASLSALDSGLDSLISALGPLDLLARPETLDAVRTVGDLAAQARQAPLVGAWLQSNGVTDSTLAALAGAAGDWAAMLEQRPSMAELRQCQEGVQVALAGGQLLRDWLTPLAWALNLLMLPLGAWLVGGQWALYRLASEQLRPLPVPPAAAAVPSSSYDEPR